MASIGLFVSVREIGVEPEIESRACDGEAPEGIQFEHIERVDRSLRDGHRLVSVEEEEAYRQGLQRLAAIGSGKKGSRQPRHVLEVRGNDTRVPPALAAGSATAAAMKLCRWLEALRIGRPKEFQWLLDKWIFRSERERGRMTLADDAEIERAGRLCDSARVQVEVRRSTVALRDRGCKTKPAPRMRIKCVDDLGKPTRDTVAVRWVMTYVAARWG